MIIVIPCAGLAGAGSHRERLVKPPGNIVFVHVYLHICIYVYRERERCMYIYIYGYVYIYIYICINVYVYTIYMCYRYVVRASLSASHLLEGG